MKLSVIMPVYSETESVPRVIDDVLNVAPQHIIEIILIVSPRSSPECFRVCGEAEKQRTLVKMVTQSRLPGFGQAYQEAFPLVRGDYVLMLDADGEFDLSAVPRMIEACESGADVAAGSRWMEGGRFEGYDAVHLVANRLFQSFLRLCFSTRLHDLTFGFKMLSAQVVRTIPWEGKGYELAMETTIKPLAYGFRVVEVPAIWRKRREGQSKNTNLVGRMKKYLPLALRIRMRR
jgi:dolichol-phosphate mannosyltransferase